uniref:Alkaline phosphatase n=1 Tax=OCS116 cluster bacterium TaxID=2030921 RepID=A0A2A4Z7G5_9PROT
MLLNVFENALEATDLQAVFIVTFVEKFIPIIPSYIMLPVIGMSATSGTDLMLRWLVATLGSICGALGWYMLGSIVGPKRIRQFVQRYGRWIFFKVHLYDKMALSYRRKPFLITVIGQLIPAVRILQALPAGVLRLPLLPFLAATAVGAQGWIIAFTTAGYYLHHAGLTPTETGFGLLISVLIIEGGAFYFGHQFYKLKQKNIFEH